MNLKDKMEEKYSLNPLSFNMIMNKIIKTPKRKKESIAGDLIVHNTF